MLWRLQTITAHASHLFDEMRNPSICDRNLRFLLYSGFLFRLFSSAVSGYRRTFLWLFSTIKNLLFSFFLFRCQPDWWQGAWNTCRATALLAGLDVGALQSLANGSNMIKSVPVIPNHLDSFSFTLFGHAVYGAIPFHLTLVVGSWFCLYSPGQLACWFCASGSPVSWKHFFTFSILFRFCIRTALIPFSHFVAFFVLWFADFWLLLLMIHD